MPEHRIRLRGAWECVYHREIAESEPDAPSRVDLPTVWQADSRHILRLTRQFGRPPVDFRVESVCLEFKNVPGLTSVRLNGQDLNYQAGQSEPIELSLGEPLLPRNGLAIEIDLDVARRSPVAWGEIALLIRPL